MIEDHIAIYSERFLKFLEVSRSQNQITPEKIISIDGIIKVTRKNNLILNEEDIVKIINYLNEKDESVVTTVGFFYALDKSEKLAQSKMKSLLSEGLL